jgi:hypothetical protein
MKNFYNSNLDYTLDDDDYGMNRYNYLFINKEINNKNEKPEILRIIYNILNGTEIKFIIILLGIIIFIYYYNIRSNIK